MGSQEFSHSEASDFRGSKDFGHLLVGSKVLSVLGILKVVFLQVGPQLLDAFCSGGLFLSNIGCEIGGELHWFRDSRLLLWSCFLDGTFFLCCFLGIFGYFGESGIF